MCGVSEDLLGAGQVILRQALLQLGQDQFVSQATKQAHIQQRATAFKGLDHPAEIGAQQANDKIIAVGHQLKTDISGFAVDLAAIGAQRQVHPCSSAGS